MQKPFSFVIPDSVEEVSITLPDGTIFNWNAGKVLELTTADKTKLTITGNDLHFTRAAVKPAVKIESAAADKKTGKQRQKKTAQYGKKDPANPAYAKEVTAEGVLDLGKPGRGRTFAIKSFKKNHVITVEDLFSRRRSINKFKGLGKSGKQLIAAALEKFIAANPRATKK